MYQRIKKRTTIEFDEPVLERIKATCAERGETLSEYVQDAVQARMYEAAQPKREFKLRSYPGGKLQPGVDINSNAALQEILDEGLPLDKLR